jgi:hypothetical protein
MPGNSRRRAWRESNVEKIKARRLNEPSNRMAQRAYIGNRYLAEWVGPVFNRVRPESTEIDSGRISIT